MLRLLALLLFSSLLPLPASPSDSGFSSDYVAALLDDYHAPNGIEMVMPKLIEYTRDEGSDDWVALQHVGGAYQMMARRMYSSGIHVDKANLGLEEAASLFKKASVAYDAFMARLKDRDVKEYPQLSYATNPSLIYRSWGDALVKLGRVEEAAEVYEEAKKKGVFKSANCRPEKEMPAINPGYIFENPFPEFEAELASLLPKIGWEFLNDGEKGGVKDGKGGWKHESGGLLDASAGNRWLQLTFFANGAAVSSPSTCESYPTLCKFVSDHAGHLSNKGQVKISVMEPGTVVLPHAGPTMERLRMHCAVMVPDNSEKSFIRVGDQKVSWEEGKCFVFSEHCEHEVVIQEDAADFRVVLIVDLPNVFLSDWEDYKGAGGSWEREKWEHLQQANKGSEAVTAADEL